MACVLEGLRLLTSRLETDATQAGALNPWLDTQNKAKIKSALPRSMLVKLNSSVRRQNLGIYIFIVVDNIFIMITRSIWWSKKRKS